MYKGKRILAVVPARGGSRGIPLKNLRKICGVPMVGLAGKISGQVPQIDRVVVSTDHEGIAQTAIAHGIDAPFRRPESISGDRIGDVDVLTHALKATEQDDGEHYDIIVMLQPTSPLRRPEHMIKAITNCVDGDFDSVWTLSPSDTKNHPLKQLVLEEGELDYFDPAGACIIARQQLSQLYHRNGVAYVNTRSCLLDQKSLKGEKSGAVVIDEPMVSIDTEWDIKLVEFILSHPAMGGS